MGGGFGRYRVWPYHGTVSRGTVFGGMTVYTMYTWRCKGIPHGFNALVSSGKLLPLPSRGGASTGYSSLAGAGLPCVDPLVTKYAGRTGRAFHRV